MRTYQDLIHQFVAQELPSAASPQSRFDAIVSAIIGGKQRRFGPLPDPEIQVAVRDLVRAALAKEGQNTLPPVIDFFLPWGSRKQADGAPLDLLEFMALRQLQCLQHDLDRQGIASHFHFRLEDLTDQYLFGQQSPAQSQDYIANFTALVFEFLGMSVESVRLESQFTSPLAFMTQADDVAPLFYQHFVSPSEETLAKLQGIGWVGSLPMEQQSYYLRTYESFGMKPEAARWEMARYFAATYARTIQRATAAPSVPHLLIAFTHPVPGNPVSKTRLHYRTIPERFTNNHRSPWIGKGYFQIDEHDRTIPKSAGPFEALDFQRHSVKVGNATVQTDYLLV